MTRQKNFCTKQEFPYQLLSDPDKETIRAYKAIGMKNMYGKEYMGIGRSTFLIDTKGKINRVWPKVKVDGHVEEVLKAVKECP